MNLYKKLQLEIIIMVHLVNNDDYITWMVITPKKKWNDKEIIRKEERINYLFF